MSREEVIRALEANVDKRVLITFLDGEMQLVTVVNFDAEGFVNKIGDEFFWATFEDVFEVQPESEL